MSELDEVFVVDVIADTDNKDNDNFVTLQPSLANYRGVLSYDSAGNANITIYRNNDDTVMLDMSLDNGEVNEYSDDLLS